MLIPILGLLTLVLLAVISRRYFGTVNRPVFLVLLTVVLLLFSGLRHKTVGVDTANYYGRFYDFVYSDHAQALRLSSALKDSGYYMLNWYFSRVIPDGQIWIAFVSFVYILGVSLVCYWESPDYGFSMLYVYCMGLFFFSMTGLRQTLASGLVMMSYIFLVKRKLIPFVILVYLASRMHESAWIFLIIYPVANLRTGWLRLLAVLIFFILVLAFRDSIGSWMIGLFPGDVLDERFVGYMNSTTQYTASGFIIQLAIFIFCMRYHSAVVADLPHREVLYNMAFFALIFQAAAMSIAEFFRISMFFSWCYVPLLPICMQYERDQRNYEFVRIGLIVAFIAYFMYSTLDSCGIVPYHFFWETVA